MTIKMIATDMDGTFLDGDSAFNRPRFQQLLNEMAAQQVKFVVASGNQYPHLPPYFDGLTGEITYLAEDGAHIVLAGEAISEDVIQAETLQQFLNWLPTTPLFANAWVILSGQRASYTEMLPNSKRFKASHYFYGDMQHVPDLREVTDGIYKIDISWAQFDVSAQEQLVNATFPGKLRATSSGLGGIDVVLPHVNKAYGLAKLQAKWGITRDETLAFGDSGNDLEMLAMAKYGYAMANAPENVRQAVDYVTPLDNDHDGVLDVIAQYLNV
jgi:Cof subfamily protein (haloacid dehalogenase superfamily)